jgi:hypothetical protein
LWNRLDINDPYNIMLLRDMRVSVLEQVFQSLSLV